MTSEAPYPPATRARPRRSLLFVPGTRPDRFGKAASSGADMICLDLEDAVPPSQKSAARSHVMEYLQRANAACDVSVRINTLRSREGLEDLLALGSSDARPALVAIPKVESAAEIEIVRSALFRENVSPEIIALVESLCGLERVNEIARAPGVAIVGLGTADLSAEMGTTMEWMPMLLARMQLVQAAKAARIRALDGAWLQLDDSEGLESETRQAAALGFTAKVCLHPHQIQTVHAALQPTREAIEQAREIVAAFEASAGAAVQLRGRMIDLPVVEAAQRLLGDWENTPGKTEPRPD